MKLRPVEDRILVEPDEVVGEKKTASGIIMPDINTEKPQRGTVVAVGPGKYEHGRWAKPDIFPGERVIFGKYSGVEMSPGNGKTYLVLRASDILAIEE
jgi:chaperonin GroES